MSNSTSIRKRTQAEDTKDTINNTSTINGRNVSTTFPQDSNRTPSISSPTAIATTIFSPALITTLILIFGGCCSNVYTLESILKLSPATGTLVTFLQFLLTSFITLRSQLTTKRVQKDGSPASSSLSFLPTLRNRIIPLSKWLIYTAFFLAINILNNTAFNYRISVPLHIILRSAGPVTSMLVGYFAGGRRYTSRQIIAVIFLFGGVVLAALSDAKSKSHARQDSVVNDEGEDNPIQNIASALQETKLSDQAPGFVLLFTALLLSAIMGLYTDDLYNKYGRSTAVTNENIFYSHTLSLPFFALQSKTLQNQYSTLRTNILSSNSNPVSNQLDFIGLGQLQPLIAFLPTSISSVLAKSRYLDIKPFLLLLANALTQIVCITGVHRLSTQTTSLTVSIILNIRKLVSLLLSIWLFGNNLPNGVALGALLVFLGGGLYGWKPKGKKIDAERKKQIGSKKEL